MQIQISGNKIDIGESLEDHARKGLLSINEKFTLRPTSASVTFSREKHEFTCEASMHLSSGMNAHCSSRSTEIYSCFDEALTRLEKQIRRHKRKIKKHNHVKNHVESFEEINESSKDD